MPLQHKRKRTFRKRPIRKRIHKKRNTELMIYKAVGIAPFPSRLRTTFTTSVYGNFLLGGTNGQALVSLNGPFKPFQTNAIPGALPAVATLNPTGYSSLANANFYQNYRVLSSSIEVEFLPEALTDTLQVVVLPQFTFNTLTTSVAMNQPFAKSGLMSSSKDDHNSKRGSELRHFMSQHKLLGVSPRAIEEDLSGAYVSQYNSYPSQQAYWQIVWATPDGNATVANCKIRVTVKHHTELFNPFTGNTKET